MIAGIYNSLAFDVALVNSYISGEDTTGEGKTNRTQRHASSRWNQINPHTNQNNRAFELSNTTNTLLRQRGLPVNQNESKSHSFWDSLRSLNIICKCFLWTKNSQVRAKRYQEDLENFMEEIDFIKI